MPDEFTVVFESRDQRAVSDRALVLHSLGIPYECDLETSAGGHGWSYYNHMLPKAFAFMLARLEQERLRV